MDGRQASLITSSYAEISPKIAAVVSRFYERLFESAPAVRSLFPEDTEKLRAHFAAAIALMARNAGHIAVMKQPLRDLGRRHATYGAAAEHYPIVAELLLATLQEAAGKLWTPDTADAWRTLISFVAKEMMAGAENPSGSAS